MDTREPQLLHYVGEAPEGPWAIFSEPGGQGWRLVSVLVPRTLWMQLTRRDPFSSEMQLLEAVGKKAILRAAAAGPLPPAIWVTPEMVDLTLDPYGPPWETLSVCGRCGGTVPSGEVLEGIKNALPPNTRGDTEVLVLCPSCGVQTRFVLTPFGAARA
jgi:hypothetical protein